MVPCFDLVMSKHGALRTLIYDAIISSSVSAFCLSLIHRDTVIVHDVFQRMHQQNHGFQVRAAMFERCYKFVLQSIHVCNYLVNHLLINMDDTVSNTVWISHLIFHSFAAIRVIVRRSRAPNSSLNVNDIFYCTPPKTNTWFTLKSPRLKRKIIWTKPLHFGVPALGLLISYVLKNHLKINGWFT